jgi:hypothetical protein
MTFGTWSWVCQPHAPAAFTPRKFSWYSFSLGGWVHPRAMVRSEGNMSLKNPVTPPGIDRGTVRLVALRPNQYATRDPPPLLYKIALQKFIFKNKNSFCQHRYFPKSCYFHCNFHGFWKMCHCLLKIAVGRTSRYVCLRSLQNISQ